MSHPHQARRRRRRRRAREQWFRWYANTSAAFWRDERKRRRDELAAGRRAMQPALQALYEKFCEQNGLPAGGKLVWTGP